MEFDRQQIINKVYDHFITNDAPFGYDVSNEQCEYLTKDGRRCAIGIFLKEDCAKRAIGSVVDIFLKTPYLLPWTKDQLMEKYKEESNNLLFLRNNLLFLRTLQNNHDYAAEISVENVADRKIIFRDRIKEMCQKYDLKFPGDN